MSGTGFSPQRAADHDRLVKHLVTRLDGLGYQPEELPVDGDRPDVKIRDWDGRTAYVDLKTAHQGHENFSIKRGTFQTAAAISSQGTPVYIISVHDKHAWVDTPETYGARLIGGPRRPTGKASNTDWLLARPGGTPFEQFFVPVHGTEHGAPTDEPPPPQPADADPDAQLIFGDSGHPDTDILPTPAQVREYALTGTFTPDPAGWTS